MKKTASNVQSLQDVQDVEFVTIERRPFGKSEPQQLVRLADTEISFDSLGIQRTVVLETEQNQRHGIYTTVLKPNLESENDLQLTLDSNLQQISKLSQHLENNQQQLLEGTTKSIVSEQQNNWPSMTSNCMMPCALSFGPRINSR